MDGRLFGASFSVAVFAACAASAGEAEYAERLCAGMAREVATGGGSRADCADETRAIEIDFSPHWASAVGQALYYGRVLDKRPTVVLICDVDLENPFARSCFDHAYRASYGVRGEADVFVCPASAEAINDCRQGGG